MTVQLYFALVGFYQAGDHIEDGGLAGPVRPQQPDRLALANRKADVLHNHSTAIALPKAMHGENPLPAGRSPRFWSRSVALAAQPFAPARGRVYALAQGVVAHLRSIASIEART